MVGTAATASGALMAANARAAPAGPRGARGPRNDKPLTGARSRRLANAFAKGRAAELAPRAALGGARSEGNGDGGDGTGPRRIPRSFVTGASAPAPVPRSPSPEPSPIVVLGAIPEPVSQAVVEDPPSSRAKKPSAPDKKSGSTRKSSPGVLSRYQKDTQYAQAAHLEGVRQGWPLARLLDQLPPIPDKDAINMSTARPHLQLYETLVDCGRLHNALELLRALKTAGLNTVGGRVSNKAFLRQCARRSAVAVAFDFVSFVDYPDVRLYNMLLSVCASAADSRSAFAAFVMMYDNGVQPDVMAYTTLISACAKAGELEKAFETFRRMEMDGLEGNVVTYGALMDALSRRVMELTKVSIHKKRSASNGESAIGSGAGDDAGVIGGSRSEEIDSSGEVAATLRRCFDLREEMDDAGVAPDGTMINTILSACGRAAEVRALSADALQKAFDLYDEMESSDEADLAPDAYTYSALIKACVNAGQSNRGLSLYDRAMDPSSGIEPSIMVFQEAMIACSHLADLGKAWQIWEDMRVERVAPDAMLYATLIAVAGRAGEREEAKRVVFEMERAGVAPTPEVFASLAGIAARAGDGAGVESAIAEVASRGLAVPMEMYNALVTAAARRGDVDAAQEAVLRLRAAGFACDGDTYHALMRAAGSAVRPDLAWRWYEEAKTTGTVEMTRHHFTMLVIASGRGGDMDKMFEAEAEMRAAGLEPDEQTWCELLSSCARHGDASLTWDTYKRSRNAGQPPSEVALNILIGVTLLKIRALTDPDDRRNIKRAQWDQDDDSSRRKKEEPEWTEWADRAIAAYHEATVAGVRPRLATFSAMLACLRPPTLPSLRAVDRETRPGSKAESLARAVSHEDSSHEDARKYYPLRALIMYEEAQAIGVVPKFATETDSVYDIRKFPPAAAEVAVLTMLRVFRRYSDAHAGAGDAELPDVTLRVLSDEEHEEMIASGDDEGRRLAQTGDRVIVLLRRLRFNYGGSLSAGRIELSGHVIKRWLQAKPPKEERAPGVEAGLRQNLQDQARNIRMRSFDDSDGSGYGGASGATDWGAVFGRRGGAAGGNSPGSGRSRGLGAGSDIDFFGASDNRYSNDSGDSGEYSYRPKKNRWVNTGWDNDEKVDDCMMGELTRIITKDASGGGSGSFDSGSGDSGSGDVRYSRDGDW